MNPMELYVDKPEGVALVNPSNGLYFQCSFEHNCAHCIAECSTRGEYKSNYTRMKAWRTTETSKYDMKFLAGPYMSLLEYNIQVLQNDDGTVAFRCENGLFLDQSTGELEWNSLDDYLCTKSGICPTCKFLLECGSIVPIHLEILDIRWGERDGEVMANPSVVATDMSDNWSEQTLMTTLTLDYTSTKSDTTVWQQAWGFEFGVSATVECGIPFVGGGSVTTSSTVSYDGSEGAEHTVEEEQSFHEEKEFPCPPHSRCIFKLIVRKLDNVDMPFTATVRRNLEDGTLTQWKEEGTWYGVTAFDSWSAFCTEDLITGESNCPPEYQTPVQLVSGHN